MSSYGKFLLRKSVMKKILKKIIYFCLKIFCKFKTKKYILFIAHNDIMLSYAYPVYERLMHDKRLRMLFCFRYKHLFIPGRIKKLKKRHRIRSIPYKIASIFKWDLIIFPDHRPWFRSDCRKIYIGHGAKAGKMVNGESYRYGSCSRDENNEIFYDKIFESSNYVKNAIKKYYPEYYPKVKVVGSLLAEKILEYSAERNEILRRINFDIYKKTVMVVSSWGSFSFLQSQGLEFIKIIPQIAKKYNIIFSVHLNNFVKEYSNGVDWRNIIGQINCKNVYTLINEEEPYHFLASADILITDMTSLGLYYPVLVRPMIFYDNQNINCVYCHLYK